MSYEMYRQQFEGDSFNDILVDQLRRAPWILVSFALHALIFILVWWLTNDPKDIQSLADTEVALDEEIIDEEEEEEEEPEEEEPEPEELIEDPVEVDEEVDEHDEDETNEEYEEIRGEEDQINDKPMDASSNNDAIGLGGGAGGAFGGRRGGRRRLRKGRGKRGQAVVDRGLEWLSLHQSKDGSWDCDEFAKNGDPAKGALCDGKGGPLYDVGVSGLALLAFLGAGETHKAGDYRATVRKGLSWLKEQQDSEGCFGPRTVNNFTYNHAIGALAMCEAYAITKAPLFKRAAEKGIEFIVACQNPYKAWRYGEADGDNDTSVTGWMVMALKSGKAGGLAVDPKGFEWALSFIEDMTDEENGRTGYNSPGGLPVREKGKIEEFPSSESESLTAVAMLVRVFAGQNPEEHPMVKLGSDLLLEKLPLWDESRGSIDMYYWYYGTLAMFQVGGSAWTEWNKKMEEAVIETQRDDGNFSGSWNPIGAWGENGGRVYATALQTLCLEVYYRYGKVFGTR
ncbi:MAG: prenyltransferase/squalene oxidase repeat-containing protein [Planctomycetota bacterium]